ncbi:12945_t:CDS:2, partial [Racocetra fulgida]
KEQKLALFKGLKVAQFGWFMKLHLGNWPVIYVNFKDLCDKSWELMLNSIKERISDIYKEHRYMIDNKNLHIEDESLFKNILNETIDEPHLINAISRQASFLSGLNNVVHYPMHELPGIYGRAEYSDMFGFTEAEVKLLLSKNNQNLELDNLRTQYNGYQTIDKQWMSTEAKLVIPNKEVAEQWKEWIIDFIGVTLAMFHGDDYQVVSNREAGNGRPDVRIIPINQKSDTCIIFEFKLAKSENRDEMKISAKNGLNQIADKNYRSNTANHIETIVEVAIAFCKKSTFVSAQLLRRKKGGKKGKLSTNAWEIYSSEES